MGTLECVIRETTSLSSSRWVVGKLDAWNEATKRRYLEAYKASDWDTVYALTEDMGGSQFWRDLAQEELADVIEEQMED
jgi:hypothetical protein